ncbi:aspartate dehydrogenase [Loktanella sp. 5RATIMAR09]|uniref:aspartate dehydrogenase n=1 Tax=Loktanella sp. 5RATIMAR09 TaxID=1225655 RepID=UPI0006EB7639|nr:aspartate dehydrogenase [Loktanella sp. 5RATIMAR09]KQI71845.1 aspartate dehydrogenase [Loktanella sp. 5RATIMAR09]
MLRNVAIIGDGAIARYVRAKLPALNIAEIATIVRSGKEATGATPLRISDLNNLPSRPDLVIDCGGHQALATHGPVALALGIDVTTVSLGALADRKIAQSLHDAATAGGARLHLASGAIGGLDALRSAAVGTISEVSYTGRKPPKGWRGSPAEAAIDLDAITAPTPHFNGTAREAALAYPKNANVAAAVALAGVGFDDTQVCLIADPTVTENIHDIAVKGAFGAFHFQIAGEGLPDNPRSSALAAMSIVAALTEMQKQIGF